MREQNRENIEGKFGKYMTVESLRFLYKKRQSAIENDDLKVRGHVKNRMAKFNKLHGNHNCCVK